MNRPAALRSLLLSFSVAGLMAGCAGGVEGEISKACMEQFATVAKCMMGGGEN